MPNFEGTYLNLQKSSKIYVCKKTKLLISNILNMISFKACMNRQVLLIFFTLLFDKEKADYKGEGEGEGDCKGNLWPYIL